MLHGLHEKIAMCVVLLNYDGKRRNALPGQTMTRLTEGDIVYRLQF